MSVCRLLAFECIPNRKASPSAFNLHLYPPRQSSTSRCIRHTMCCAENNSLPQPPTNRSPTATQAGGGVIAERYELRLGRSAEPGLRLRLIAAVHDYVRVASRSDIKILGDWVYEIRKCAGGGQVSQGNNTIPVNYRRFRMLKPR